MAPVGGFTQFNGLPDSAPEEANVLLLPLPYEGTVSGRGGTAQGPAAIWAASQQGEFFDDELGVSYDDWTYYSAQPPAWTADPAQYQKRILAIARELNDYGGLVVGVGGEHSVTPPLVTAAMPTRSLKGLTVVQFDAHADLRPTWDGTPASHACAMYPLVERGASLVSIGLGDISREEWAYAKTRDVQFFRAQYLAQNDALLLKRLREITGPVYVTFDVDCLDLSLCPGTGTPIVGGLGWWQTLRYLKTLLFENQATRLIGCDVVEVAPQPDTQINEHVGISLIMKLLAYEFASPKPTP